MAFNGAGVFQRLYDWTDDKLAGIKVRADRMDAEMDGIATALSNCICRDGQSTITASIPMNSNKLTGLAAGTSAGDSVRYEQVGLLAAANIFTVAGTNRFINTTDSASVQALRIEGDRATPADGDAAYVSLMLSDSGGTQTEFARMTWTAVDVTDGTLEDGSLTFGVITAGSLVSELVLDGAALTPFASGGLNLGSTTLPWGSAFFASGSVLNFNNGDVTITHAANLLTVAGGDFKLGTSAVFETGTIELGHASDTTLSRGAAGRLDIEGGAGSLYAVGLEVGHATDTTITRASAGMIAVEGTTIEPGANRASFRAHKNGSNQAIASASLTKVTFGTESFDVGSKFASSTWTPPAGTCLLTAHVTVEDVQFSDQVNLYIYKNGSGVFRSAFPSKLASDEPQTLEINVVEQCNGTDYYEVYIDSSSDTAYTINGSAGTTYFGGTML